MENSNKIIPLDEVLTLMLAGNFTFTAISGKTGDHFTYNVKFKTNSEFYEWNVQVLGHLNKYADIGVLTFYEQVDFKPINFTHYEKKALASFIAILHILKNKVEGLIEFKASGKCSRCGRMLTTPESLEKNIGPECEKQHKEFIMSLIE